MQFLANEELAIAKSTCLHRVPVNDNLFDVRKVVLIITGPPDNTGQECKVYPIPALKECICCVCLPLKSFGCRACVVSCNTIIWCNEGDIDHSSCEEDPHEDELVELWKLQIRVFIEAV